MTHTGMKGDAPAAKSVAVVATGVEGEGGDGDALGMKKEAPTRTRRGEDNGGDGMDRGARTVMKSTMDCLRKWQHRD